MQDPSSQLPRDSANQTGPNTKPEEPPGKPRRGIYLLPNLFTTAALFCGFFAVIAAISGRFSIAAIAVLVGAVLDGLDGRVARMTNTQSEFGAEYDSLSDVVSFGVAPALIVYLWALQDVAAFGWQNIGWVFAFLYAACAALRLARFNVQIGKVDKRFFQGLAVPAAASIMVCLVWVADDLGYRGADFANLCLAFSVVIGLLMVSKFPYYSFKDLGSGVRIPFIALLVPVLLLFIAAIDPPKALFALALLYGLSGPALSGYRWIRRRVRRELSAS